MYTLMDDYAAGVWLSPEKPCLSLYQPTHRHHPENQQDPIRFRNLVKSMEETLRQKHTKREVQQLLQPFHDLAEDGDFWSQSLDGLAVLGAPNLFRFYRLQRRVPEIAIVADSFHLKPLMRILQSADRYHVLGLTRREAKLFEGNRDVIDEVKLAPAVPRTITDALGEKPRETPPRSFYSAGAGGPVIRHGFTSKQDLLEAEVERFFRAVDRGVWEHHSQSSRMPLILAALPENQTLFRSISQNPYLMADGIDVHPDSLDSATLRERAWRVMEPRYLARLAGLVEQFATATAKGLGSDDLADVAQAAVSGRVATLLIEAEKHIPGKLNRTSGRITLGDHEQPEIDDLLDDIAEVVVSKSGEVVIVPAERMPTRSGLAAIYRF